MPVNLCLVSSLFSHLDGFHRKQVIYAVSKQVSHFYLLTTYPLDGLVFIWLEVVLHLCAWWILVLSNEIILNEIPLFFLIKC